MSGPRLRFFSLGGTIAMAPRDDGAGAPAAGGVVPRHDAEDLLRAVPALARVGRIEPASLRRVASANLSIRDALRLAAEVVRAAEDGIDGVFVAQGTDTLEEMAFLLHCLLARPPVPVVLTGAMRPAHAPGADGPANLLFAARAAATPACRELGVVVAMNGRLFDAVHVAKRHSWAPDAFSAGEAGAVGRWCEDAVEILSRPAAPLEPLLDEEAQARLVERRTFAQVPIVEALFDAPPDPLRAVLDRADGAVLAAFGAGHVPETWVETLADFAQHHPLVLASRTGEGPVLHATYGYPGSESDLLARGLIAAGRLSPRKARLALLLLLTAGCGRDGIRDRLARMTMPARSR